MAHVIAMCTAKGGVGKTTISINLTAALAIRGKKCLLIDNDPQGNSTVGLGVNPYKLENGTLRDVVIDWTEAKNAIVKIKENFFLLPTEIGYSKAEAKAEGLERSAILHTRLNEVLEDYDYVIVDCPPSIGFFTVNALRFANSMFIPFQPQRFSMEGLKQIVDVYGDIKIKEKLNRGLEFYIIPSLYEKREVMQNEYLTQLEVGYGSQRILPGISKSAALNKSVA